MTRTTRAPFLTLLVAGLALAALRPASAQITVFDDFGPAGAYNTASGYIIAGPKTVGNPQDIAMSFTNSTGFAIALTKIKIQLDTAAVSPDNKVTVNVYSDSANTPGSILESFTGVVVPATPGSGSISAITLNSVSNPLLNNGTQYWIGVIATPVNLNVIDFWRLNSTGTFGTVAQRAGAGGAWASAPQRTMAAFSVGGTAPAPGSLLTLGILGATGVGFAIRRKRA